ncbi:MAG: DUF167 domain-containing protein [Eubacteriales bacterium]|nr:DUF167 domain-containing protein [Eubacteriales bacterium]MDD3845497.1 DUF167 domain-containing protein [Syntrophorhabdaceae bacterium]
MNVEIRVIPNARKRSIARTQAGITVRLTALPLEGRANEELVRYLSDIFKVKRSAIRILRGEKARRKVLEIPIDEKLLQTLLGETV